MSDYLIVVVNRSVARLFTLEPVEFPELESGPRLTECGQLINAEIADSHDLFTDSKTGRGAAPQSSAVHGYEDNRDQHLDEVRRRFAGKVIEGVLKQAKNKRVRTIILGSSARMRRFLYHVEASHPECKNRIKKKKSQVILVRFLYHDMEALIRQEYRIQKLSKNMINFSPYKIHAYLAEEGLVPKQERRVADRTT